MFSPEEPARSPGRTVSSSSCGGRLGLLPHGSVLGSGSPVRRGSRGSRRRTPRRSSHGRGPRGGDRRARCDRWERRSRPVSHRGRSTRRGRDRRPHTARPRLRPASPSKTRFHTVCMEGSWKFECTAKTSHHLDLDSGLLLPELAPRRIAHVLVVLHVAAGDAPLAAERAARPPAEEHPAPLRRAGSARLRRPGSARRRRSSPGRRAVRGRGSCAGRVPSRIGDRTRTRAASAGHREPAVGP